MIRFFLLLLPFCVLFAEQKEQTVEYSFEKVVQAYQEKKWTDLLDSSKIVLQEFARTPFAEEALFFQAVAYFHLNNYERANHFFSRFLKTKAAVHHFEESIAYKYRIGMAYKNGERKHLFGVDSLPKWVGGKEDAIEIFDEVIHALPQDDLAAQSLYAKGDILFVFKEYEDSLEVYQELLRRFPVHELAIEAYLDIGRVYLQKIDPKQQDESVLHLAQLNYEAFAKAFPKEKRLAEAKNMLLEMQQIYADSLFEIARFYERTKKPSAAQIYYERIVQQFPETKSAIFSKRRLKKMRQK